MDALIQEIDRCGNGLVYLIELFETRWAAMGDWIERATYTDKNEQNSFRMKAYLQNTLKNHINYLGETEASQDLNRLLRRFDKESSTSAYRDEFNEKVLAQGILPDLLFQIVVNTLGSNWFYSK